MGNMGIGYGNIDIDNLFDNVAAYSNCVIKKCCCDTNAEIIAIWVKYLFENGVIVTELKTDKIGLEEYYINLMERGGEVKYGY